VSEVCAYSLLGGQLTVKYQVMVRLRGTIGQTTSAARNHLPSSSSLRPQSSRRPIRVRVMAAMLIRGQWVRSWSITLPGRHLVTVSQSFRRQTMFIKTHLYRMVP